MFRTGILCFFLLILTFLSTSFCQEESPIVVRETSLAETLKQTLKENKQLKQENEELKEELNGAVLRSNIFAERIRRLNDQIDNLENKINSLQAEFDKEKEAIREGLLAKNDSCTDDLTQCREKSKNLEDFIANIREKKHEDEYFSMWQQAEQELIALKTKLQDLTLTKEKLKQESGKAHYNLGNLFFRNAEYKKAAVEYELALRLLPDDADIYYNLAVLYDYYLQNSEKAKIYYTKFLRKNPETSESLFIKERVAENDFKSRFDSDF